MIFRVTYKGSNEVLTEDWDFVKTVLATGGTKEEIQEAFENKLEEDYVYVTVEVEETIDINDKSQMNNL